MEDEEGNNINYTDGPLMTVRPTGLGMSIDVRSVELILTALEIGYTAYKEIPQVKEVVDQLIDSSIEFIASKFKQMTTPGQKVAYNGGLENAPGNNEIYIKPISLLNGARTDYTLKAGTTVKISMSLKFFVYHWEESDGTVTVMD